MSALSNLVYSICLVWFMRVSTTMTVFFSFADDEREHILENFTNCMLHLHDLYKSRIALGGKTDIRLNSTERTGVLRRALKGRLMPFTIDNPLVTIYDDEPTSILSYFLSTK